MNDRLHLDLREHFEAIETGREPVTIEEIVRRTAPHRLPWAGIAAAAVAVAALVLFAWLLVPGSEPDVARSTTVPTSETTVPEDDSGAATGRTDLGVVATPIGPISWVSWEPRAIADIDSRLPLSTWILGEAGDRLYLILQEPDGRPVANVVSTADGRSWTQETALETRLFPVGFFDLGGEAALMWPDDGNVVLSRPSTGWAAETVGRVPYRATTPESDVFLEDRFAGYPAAGDTFVVGQHIAHVILDLGEAWMGESVELTARWSQSPSTLVVEVASVPAGSRLIPGQTVATVTWEAPLSDDELAGLAAMWDGYTHPDNGAHPYLEAFQTVWQSDALGGLGAPVVDRGEPPTLQPEEGWPWYDVYPFVFGDELVRTTGAAFEIWDGEQWLPWDAPGIPFPADAWPQQAGGGWVAGTDAGRFWVSSDGVSWVESELPEPDLGVVWGWDHIGLGPGGWMAVGIRDSETRQSAPILVSPDGRGWTRIEYPGGLDPDDPYFVRVSGRFVLAWVSGAGTANPLDLVSRLYLGTLETP
jgi:hypothetical protein